MNKLTLVEDIYVTEYPDYSSFKKDNAWKKFFTDPNTRQERFEKMGVKINGNVAIIPIDILDIGLNFNYEKNPYTFKMILLKHLKEIYNNELKNKPSIKINLTMSLQQAIETSEIHHIQQFDILL